MGERENQYIPCQDLPIGDHILDHCLGLPMDAPILLSTHSRESEMNELSES